MILSKEVVWHADINGDSLIANWVKVRRYVNGYKN